MLFVVKVDKCSKKLQGVHCSIHPTHPPARPPRRYKTLHVQSSVGTVVKTGEDDDPIAVMTALNTQRYRGTDFAKQIRGFLLGKCGDEGVRRQFEQVGGGW